MLGFLLLISMNNKRMISWCSGILTTIFLSTVAHAQLIYVEDFDSPIGTNGDVYFATSSTYNGVTDGTGGGSGASFAGNPTFLNGQIVQSASATYGSITAAQSGKYFLYANTGGGTPAAQVWGTLSAIAVQPNRNYRFSYYLTNQDNIAPASIQELINGTNVGTAQQLSTTNTWTQISFVWNSGSNTTANLALFNNTATGSGNDFGIDTITLTDLTPEPSAFVPGMLFVSLIGGIEIRRSVKRRFDRLRRLCGR
jgi:hypothetical protein